MTGDDARAPQLEVTLDDVEVRPAHAAGAHPHEDLVFAGLGHGHVAHLERMLLDGSLPDQAPGPH